MDYTQATVLITGASSGFGEACAKRYAAAGARLVLLARSEDKLQALAATLSTPCQIVAMDVRHTEKIASLPAELPPEFSKIDILINNAGLALGLSGAGNADLAHWEQMLDTNCRGLMHMTRAFLPQMLERNRGHIVNIGSVAGHWPYPGGNAYGASKAFVQQFSRNLRCDLIGKNIRVSCIDPGLAETNFSKVRFDGDQAKADAVYQGTQALSAADIAEAIFWTSSLPAHVNINAIELMPTCQAWSPFAIDRHMT